MNDKGKYCCFFCPSKDYSEKDIGESCVSCARAYSFPLMYPPAEIGNYKIVKSLGRGFYGAAYVATTAPFNRKVVVKITPVEFQSFFSKKSFMEECQLHAQVAEKASHVVNIVDAIENKDVTFSDSKNTQLKCHVSILDYIDGHLLQDYIDGTQPITIREICQISLDLLQIKSELHENEVSHNDLHAGNLIVEQLGNNASRRNEIAGSIRVKAIDLGSLSGESKSNESRTGDYQFIADHLNSLLSRILKNPHLLSDRDNRIGLALQGIVTYLSSPVENMRLPHIADLQEQIIDTYNNSAQIHAPWLSPTRFKRFSNHYNSQTLNTWDVPKMLVDPGERWQKEIAKPGPQFITGMRGCGKTMLLKAMDIHARIAYHLQKNGEDKLIENLSQDGFVGLFVQAQRLIERKKKVTTENRLTRLFLGYAQAAVRGLLHLQSISGDLVIVGAHKKIAQKVRELVSNSEEIETAVNLDVLYDKLTSLLVKVNAGDDQIQIKINSSELFPQFAAVFKQCSQAFKNSNVYFLLDDVSTRYYTLENIEELLSSLLFQSDLCAFKFTSEWQTLELGIKSPGREHPARIGRDLVVFDLGADVASIISQKGNAGKKFIEEILEARAKLNIEQHPPYKPSEVLGDVSAEDIAREICTARKESANRKEIYKGLTCLTQVCVGDLGDVIMLYEKILEHYDPLKSLPIESNKQHKCFSALSSSRLNEINRREGYLKNHAIAFAEASHELLIHSHKEGAKNKGKVRLRQYSALYVRITTEDLNKREAQIDQLRKLIDAGVFVHAGAAPRTKTKDSNPTLQFILNFRKIYGISFYMGLANRDRFELSGSDLEKWLENSAGAKEILLRNQTTQELDVDDEIIDLVAIPTKKVKDKKEESRQIDFLQIMQKKEEKSVPEVWTPIQFSIEKLDKENLKKLNIERVVASLGFEDRTLASNNELSKFTTPENIELIKYPIKGKTGEILTLWQGAKDKINIISAEEMLVRNNTNQGLTLIDVTGLSKPVIFKTVVEELNRKGRVVICHATAEEYYPLDKDLESLFAAEKHDRDEKILETLENILTGEIGPYTEKYLIEDTGSFDPSRDRAVIAFSSSKHRRLFDLLDKENYEKICIIAPDGNDPRARVAQFAADFTRNSFADSQVLRLDSLNIKILTEKLDEQYYFLYSGLGLNIEIGLTGSKRQAIASAILASQRKISQVLYLSPHKFDENKFSKGVKNIEYFDIKLPK